MRRERTGRESYRTTGRERLKRTDMKTGRREEK
jgi:hypothetical protein